MKIIFVELLSLLLLTGISFFLFVVYYKFFNYLIGMLKTSKSKYCKKRTSKKSNRYLIVRWINL